VDCNAKVIPAGDFSICCWVNSDLTPAYSYFISQYSHDNDGLLLMITQTTGTISVYLNHNSITTTDTISANVNHFIAITRSGNTISIYIDGSLSKTGTISGNLQQLDNTFIGGSSTYYGLRTFKGKIDEVRIYTSVLTAKEVYALYKNPAGNKGAKAVDTQTLNLISASQVQPRAELFYKQVAHLGQYDDGLTETPGTGSITRNLSTTKISSGATDGGGVTFGGNTLGYRDTSGNTIGYETNCEMTAIIKFPSVPSNEVFGFGSETVTPAGGATTIPDSGFRFYNLGGTLYASNGNGATETRTDISSGLTLTNWNKYRIVWTAATSVAFYVNDILKATHTTNLPSGSAMTGNKFGTRNTTPAVSFTTLISNNYQMIVTI
jgi:hypothetical protein